ncbi:CD209 antigen-like protein C isoform X2 [Channa argus]|uniref:CD209 antigen-like protein C isoform X2 n=1 Tax=Channa argus TaxID=215402 RepID=UPI003520C4FC
MNRLMSMWRSCVVPAALLTQDQGKLVDIKPLRTGAFSEEKSKTCSSFKVATVCLGLLCFLLMFAVVGVSVFYARDVNQLSRELANNTAEKQQLLANYQNLIDEKDKLQSSFNRAGTCPSDWRRFHCSCYFLSPIKGTWTTSKQQCVNKGAHLVIINSKEEMVFLNQLGVRLKFWIGLNYSTSQKTWKWTDGGSLSTSYWQQGHPSTPQSRNSAAFNSYQTSKRPAKSWTSELGSQNLQWVCEKELTCSFNSGIFCT